MANVFGHLLPFKNGLDVTKSYIDEILESKMVMEDYLTEITKDFKTIDEAIEFINVNSKTSFELLKSCKGQKIFKI